MILARLLVRSVAFFPDSIVISKAYPTIFVVTDWTSHVITATNLFPWNVAFGTLLSVTLDALLGSLKVQSQLLASLAILFARKTCVPDGVARDACTTFADKTCKP